MAAPNPDPVESLLGQRLREPEPQRNPGVEPARLRLRLTAARAAAMDLLMHRALMRDTALAQLRDAGASDHTLWPAGSGLAQGVAAAVQGGGNMVRGASPKGSAARFGRSASNESELPVQT